MMEKEKTPFFFECKTITNVATTQELSRVKNTRPAKKTKKQPTIQDKLDEGHREIREIGRELNKKIHEADMEGEYQLKRIYTQELEDHEKSSEFFEASKSEFIHWANGRSLSTRLKDWKNRLLLNPFEGMSKEFAERIPSNYMSTMTWLNWTLDDGSMRSLMGRCAYHCFFSSHIKGNMEATQLRRRIDYLRAKETLLNFFLRYIYHNSILVLIENNSPLDEREWMIKLINKFEGYFPKLAGEDRYILFPDTHRGGFDEDVNDGEVNAIYRSIAVIKDYLNI